MSPVDVETVNERLNGLVNLLKAVGVDESGNTKRKNNNNSYNKNSAVPDARQLDDHQIAAIIQKLQMAQSEAPQIIAALEAQAKMKQRHRQRQPQVEEEEEEEEEVEEEEEEEDDEDEDSYNDDDDGNYPMVGPGCSDDVSVVSDLTTPTVVQNSHVNDEEHYRDNHALPPMLIIGGGGGGGNHHQQQQQLPPMLIAPTKRKNLVGNVRSNTLATTPLRNANGIKAPSSSKGNGGISSGSQSTPSSSNGKGAAAQRRKAYNATMERLTHDNGGVQTAPPPPGASPISYPLSPNSQPQLASSRKLKPSSSNHQHNSPIQQQQLQHQQQQPQLNSASNTDGTRKKVIRRASLASGNVPPTALSSSRSDNDWDVPPGWDAFQPSKSASTLIKSRPAPAKKNSAVGASVVDDDGFLISPTVDFDPFATAVTMRNNTNNSNNSSRSRKNTDSKSISSGSGSRRSNGSDNKPDTNVQRRVKKPSTSGPPNTGGKMYKPSSSSPSSSKNPHFVDQPTSSMPQYRPRPQYQQSMTHEPYHHHQQQQQQQSPPPSQQTSKSRRPQRRASLGV